MPRTLNQELETFFKEHVNKIWENLKPETKAKGRANLEAHVCVMMFNDHGECIADPGKIARAAPALREYDVSDATALLAKFFGDKLWALEKEIRRYRKKTM